MARNPRGEVRSRTDGTEHVPLWEGRKLSKSSGTTEKEKKYGVASLCIEASLWKRPRRRRRGYPAAYGVSPSRGQSSFINASGGFCPRLPVLFIRTCVISLGLLSVFWMIPAEACRVCMHACVRSALPLIDCAVRPLHCRALVLRDTRLNELLCIMVLRVSGPT